MAKLTSQLKATIAETEIKIRVCVVKPGVAHFAYSFEIDVKSVKTSDSIKILRLLSQDVLNSRDSGGFQIKPGTFTHPRGPYTPSISLKNEDRTLMSYDLKNGSRVECEMCKNAKEED